MPILEQNTEVEKCHLILGQMKEHYDNLPQAHYQQVWSSLAARHKRSSFLRGWLNAFSLMPRTNSHCSDLVYIDDIYSEDWSVVGKDLYEAVQTYRMTEHCATHASSEATHESSEAKQEKSPASR